MADGLDYTIIVVANGARVSPAVLAWLETRSDVRLARLKTGSYPLARRFGAELAESEFLTFLDDDDEMLPGTLAAKVAYLREHPTVDVLVTDGLRVNHTSVTKIFPPRDERREDLIEMLMCVGWSACAMTLRTQKVGLAAFDPQFRHLEWTLTTLELARHHQFAFMDEPTYRYYEDTPNSLSKSAEKYIAPPELWGRLKKSYAGTRYEAAVRRRYGSVCHNAAWQYAQQGLVRDAWRLHAESLRSPGGMSYALFSGKLALASLRHLYTKNSPQSRSAGTPG